MHSPATSRRLCPSWLPVGRHMGPDPPMAGSVHRLPRPGGLVLVTQIEPVCCKKVYLRLVPAVAYCLENLWEEKPLCLNGLASLDILSATIFSRPGICRALRGTCFLAHQVRILHKRAHRGPKFIPPSLFM